MQNYDGVCSRGGSRPNRLIWTAIWSSVWGQQLLEAAARRFYADGLAATGIDTITAEAGVAKMSLYNDFSSKADLVRAYLEARHEEWLTLCRRRLDQEPGAVRAARRVRRADRGNPPGAIPAGRPGPTQPR